MNENNIKIKELFEKIAGNSEEFTPEQLDMIISLSADFKNNDTLTNKQYEKLVGLWEYSKLGKSRQRKIPVKKWDLDKIRLRKFKGGKTYYFAGYGKSSLQIRKETFDMVAAYQARTLNKAESAQFILTMIDNDRNKFGKYGKN